MAKNDPTPPTETETLVGVLRDLLAEIQAAPHQHAHLMESEAYARALGLSYLHRVTAPVTLCADDQRKIRALLDEPTTDS